jgi:threonine/homoserine/homoserine lactone efflux protein
MRWAWVLAATLLIAPEPSLILWVLGALVLVWVVVRAARPLPGANGPAAAARERRRTQARRAVPRQRDPDAPGHTRSRAPSGLLPAV